MNEIEIKLPIIVYDMHWHEALVFLTLEDTEAYLNPTNAKNNEYKIFDARGRILSIKYIAQKESILFGIRKLDRECIVLEKIDDENHMDDLREVLIKFIARYGTTPEELNTFSLEELIREAAKLPKFWRASR